MGLTLKRTHGDLKREVMRAVNRLPGVFVFPTGVGSFRIGDRFARMGMKGTSDLVGWKITDGVHAGPMLACFVALEIKVGRDKLSREQEAFLARVSRAGGIALEIRSVEEAVGALSS